MEDNILEDNIDDKTINEKAIDTNKILYYTNPKETLNKHKKVCFIYGLIIVLLTLIIFISEFFFKFDVNYILDYYVSLTMFVDFYVGIMYITRIKRFKEEVKANNLFNLVNLKSTNINNLYSNKRTISVSRILSVLAIPLNVSLLTMYGMIIYWDIDKYNVGEQIIGYMTLILVIILSLFIIFTNIMVQSEEELYSDTELK